MPILFHKGALAFVALTTAISANSASAQIHDVMILDEAFFPAIVYVEPGDELVFFNDSDAEHTVKGGDDAWSSEIVAVGSTYTYTVNADSPLTFHSVFKDAYHDSATAFGGTISFDQAPLSQ